MNNDYLFLENLYQLLEQGYGIEETLLLLILSLRKELILRMLFLNVIFQNNFWSSLSSLPCV